ncbi:MAG TPA: BrnT family toxin [Nitrospira sp.]|nr:BrnT family toxin [Nitrospira sp.]
MTDLVTFEWDEDKDRANVKKHGVSFEEASTVFWDENARIIDDPDHSDEEERFILMGVSRNLNILVVCHCYRREGQVIRIISARRANKKELRSYKEHLI